ncbi:PREDICTED: odorant receptor 67a-like [Cyphomyrmex costatus]|nr:PREDICTED: odorant receptor 67a-like [Cyphomyrmex costatus]
MNFQNVNFLNVRLNLLSGNLLPMFNRDSSFSFFWKIYSAFVWIVYFILVIAMIPGSIYVPKEKVLKDSLLTMVIFIEILFGFLRIYTRKNLAYQFIQKLNTILHIDDETMKNVVMTTLEPVKIPLNFYFSSGMVGIIGWTCMHFVLTFQKNLFYYEDYRLPAAFSKQPFSFRVFLVGDIFILISMICTFLKKISMEVYMMHLVMMVTAQYRYIALKIAMTFQEKNEDVKYRSGHCPDYWKKEKEVKALCRHHNDVIELTLLLKQLLSLSFSLMYIMSVFRFCFIGIMFSTVASTTIGEAISIVMYTSGATVQLYILCSCVQQLVDASTEVTDKAFHENWYLLQPSTKHIFILMIMCNNLECRIATFKNFNFSLPSFMTILNQSYSIALLFLKMK